MVWCDDYRDVRSEEMSKFAALSSCTYDDDDESLLFVIHPEISLRQSQVV